MAKTQTPLIEDRAYRLGLSVHTKPQGWVQIAPGVWLGYRRNKGPGTWSIRVSNKKRGYWTDSVGTADDDPTVAGTLTYWEAVTAALKLAGTSNSGPLTVEQAIDAYNVHKGGDSNWRGVALLFGLIKGRGIDKARHPLLTRLVSSLTPADLRPFKADLVKGGMSPETVQRNLKNVSAMFNLAAKDNPTTITNAYAWKQAFGDLNAEHSEPVKKTMTESEVRAVVTAAYALDTQFGLLIELLAITGVRRSQLMRLKVGDFHDGKKPTFNMPSSRKSRTKKITYGPSPVLPHLAAALRAVTAGRDEDDQLLMQADGSPWTDNMLAARFIKITTKLAQLADQRGEKHNFLKKNKKGELVPQTAGALRHAYVTNARAKGAPVGVIAANINTSERMMMRTYSRYLRDHTDAITRGFILDMSQPETPSTPPSNVVPMRKVG